ncbi:MAG TPA: ATP-binding cassette domain-containing protein [Stellaceae bacterium]|nr:ATP-binding cassette domain-containing protein [Stellaceae bacterium]
MARLEHIGKRFGQGAPVLAEVSLALEEGGFYVVTGGAGAGKTTLCGILALALAPSQGRLLLFDRDPARLGRDGRAALRRGLGIVFQELRLVDRLSARDNVALPLRIAGAAPRRIDRDVGELLLWLGLAERAERPAGALSASERRLVAVARAIVARPRLLIADEPLADLDDAAVPGVMRVFEQVNRLGTTVLIATAGDGFAGNIAQLQYHLEDGRLASAGDVAAP